MIQSLIILISLFINFNSTPTLIPVRLIDGRQFFDEQNIEQTKFEQFKVEKTKMKKTTHKIQTKPTHKIQI